MPFKIKPTIQAVQSHMMASGHFSLVLVGEPKAPPLGERLIAAIFMDSAEMNRAFLSVPEELHTIAVRLYQEQQQRPVPGREGQIDTALANLEEDIFGAFTLNSTIRNIDVVNVATEMGYADVGGTQFRIADMTLPFIVDDSAALVK